MAAMFLIVWKKSKPLQRDGRDVSVIIRNEFQNLKTIFNICIHTEPTDATQFTVAGRLASKPPVQLQFEKNDIKMPKVTLRSHNQPLLGLAKSPSMMVTTTIDANNLTSNMAYNNKISSPYSRSLSVPGAAGSDEENEDENANFEKESTTSKVATPGNQGSKVVVHRVDDDETFTSFFKSTTFINPTIEGVVEIADFDIIKSTAK